jgi:hypothetical protein
MPEGVEFDAPKCIAAFAPAMFLQTALPLVMPLNNVTEMTTVNARRWRTGSTAAATKRIEAGRGGLVDARHLAAIAGAALWTALPSGGGEASPSRARRAGLAAKFSIRRCPRDPRLRYQLGPRP